MGLPIVSYLFFPMFGAALAACMDGNSCPCQDGETGIVTMGYDPFGFSADELAMFPVVEKSWNDFCGQVVLRFVPTPGATSICAVVKSDLWGQGKEHDARTLRSGGILELGRVLNCGGLPSPCFQAILAHEVGHMLGLHHVDDPRALMHAEIPCSTPNEADRQEARNAGISLL